jgi:hypothetical protein
MLAGCIMIGASVLPWLNDPLGDAYTAWELPVDIGWQVHSSIFSYGLLCLCGAVFCFVIAYGRLKPLLSEDAASVMGNLSSKVGDIRGKRFSVLVGILCLAPVLLFLWQYLFADVHAMEVLAQHRTQLLLIQRYLGYSLAGPLITIDPFSVHTSTFLSRLELLMDQIALGLIFPLVSAGLLMSQRRSLLAARVTPIKRRRSYLWFAGVALGVLIPGIVLGRAPAAMVCEYQANGDLAAGNYASALSWLNAALVLNPALNQVTYFHVGRGQAWYFLHPGVQSDDSHVYLASLYRNQGDYLGSYQELLAVSHVQRATPWMIDELSITLARLAEAAQQGSLPTPGTDQDAASLPWVQTLVQVDASNIYGQYVVGRIRYDLRNFKACIAQMAMVVQLNHNPDVQSSAYTYMALSMAGLGDAVDERRLLLKAVELDPYYRNNTAREALSGLH